MGNQLFWLFFYYLEDKEQLEDYLILTLNKAIEKASAINEAELAAAAKDGMPNIPGL